MWNSIQIKQYQKTILTQILSSQFVYSKINEKCELKAHEISIEKKKKKKFYYLYLFLTTKQKPYVKEQYIVSKNLNKKNSLTRTKIRSVKWKVAIPKSNANDLLSYMLFQILPSQINFEQKVLRLNAKNLDLIIPYAPLTTRTEGLKPKNSYFPVISLIWRLKWTKNTSIFQKIFILKHLRILSEFSHFKRLENEL